MNFSLEIGPHTDIDTLPKVKDVYITMLPGNDFKEVAKKAKELVQSGFNAVPHFPARSIKNLNELKDYMKLILDYYPETIFYEDLEKKNKIIDKELNLFKEKELPTK